MITKHLLTAQSRIVSDYIVQNHRYGFSRSSKFLHFIRQILNRISNQQGRTLRRQQQTQLEIRQASLQEIEAKRPKNQLEAERQFQDQQQIVSSLQEARLRRIDNILGTKTYFHETKLYQQRLDSEHIMKISRLYKKFKQTSREDLKYTNPQVKPENMFKNKKKYNRLLQKLKKYPESYAEIEVFKEENQGKKNEMNLLIKMLGDEALYTNLALASLTETLDSIEKEKIYIEKENHLIEAEFDQEPIIINGYTYFHPLYSNSLFRIRSSAFTNKLRSSFTQLSELSEHQPTLQELFSIQDVYQCLKEYYFDERVSKYIQKIQNDQMEYFLNNLIVSPDGKHVVAIIDLLGTNQEYVAIYKYVGLSQQEALPFSKGNLIFNLLPEMHLQNEGILYYIQRTQEGMFTEFTRAKFSKNSETTPIQSSSHIYNNLSTRLIYKSAPYNRLKILQGKAAFLPDTKTQISANYSHNIILQQSEAAAPDVNNKIYIINHEQSMTKQDNTLEEITVNSWDSHKMEKIMKQLPQKIKQNYKKVKFSHDCYEVIGLGYLLVRYLLLNNSSSTEYSYMEQLKYGLNTKIAHFVTLIPYHGVDLGLKPQQHQLLVFSKNSLINRQQSQQKPSIIHENLAEKIKHSSHQLVLSSNKPISDSKINVNEQSVLFVCKQQQYFTTISINHLSMNNIYMIMTMGLESLYNNNYLHVYPLRVGVKPYSIYLDGLPIEVSNKNNQWPHKINISIQTPLLSSKFTYQLWSKQLREMINQRIYSETVSIEPDSQDSLEIRVLSLDRFLNPETKPNNPKQQFVILYLPSLKSDRLNQLVVRKLLEKGVIFIEITKGLGIFGSDMVELFKGCKRNHINHTESLLKVIEFIKENISDNVGLYAKGGPACFSSFLLNVLENQNSDFLNATVLHDGVYDLEKIPTQQTKRFEYFFGDDPKIWNGKNPLDFQLFNPKKVYPKKQQQQFLSFNEIMIRNLKNILVSSLDKDHRAQSRKLIRKLRLNKDLYYDTVYLKEFDTEYECDLFNLGFLYGKMKDMAVKDRQQQQKQKFEEINTKIFYEHEDRTRSRLKIDQ